MRSVLTIDTATSRCTPARAPAVWRFRVAFTKKSVASCWSGDGPLAASITRSTPMSASARPLPVTRLTPVVRDIGTTW